VKAKKSVSELIRSTRKAQEISQEAIAEALGVSIKFISLVENEERQLAVEHFPKLAEFLEIPLKELFNAKLFDDKTISEYRKIRKELLDPESDQVGKAIRLKSIKKMRVKEIDEIVKFLEIQKQEAIAQAKIGTIEKCRIEKQIQLLTEEKKSLGFGQLMLLEV